ncbi:MAG: OmpA family protein [Bacteroidia bacterium]
MKLHKIFFSVLISILSTAIHAQTLKPTDKLALVTGTATNFKKIPLKKEMLMFVDVKTKKEYKVNTNDKGAFEVLLPVSTTYSLKYKNFTADMDYTKMEVPADANATYEVGVQIDPPKEFTLSDVLFDTGKSTLKSSSFKQLNDLVEVLKMKNTMVVEIQGHTDNVGKPEENLKLSEERAKAVREYLLKKGIEATRVTAKGYGDTMPVAYNTDEAGRAKNRRTQLKVIKE